MDQQQNITKNVILNNCPLQLNNGCKLLIKAEVVDPVETSSLGQQKVQQCIHLHYTKCVLHDKYKGVKSTKNNCKRIKSYKIEISLIVVQKNMCFVSQLLENKAEMTQVFFEYISKKLRLCLVFV